MIEFLLPPLIAAIGLTLATGPLGCFIVWNRMSYFGDTLAHSGLLGVTLGFMLHLNTPLAILLACTLIALTLWRLQASQMLGNDTLLGILSHSSLALGLIGISLLENTRVNVYGLLFGDLLTVTWSEVSLIYLVAIFCITLLIANWRKLLLFVIDADLAQVEGHPVSGVRLLLMLLVALMIAIAMRVVGVLLITALLIIPAAASRYHSSSPEAMAILSTVTGIISVVAGITAAFLLDLPAGPAIVISASLLFVMSLVTRR